MTPITGPELHKCSSPELQTSHSPQPIQGYTILLSPILTLVASEPIATTSPKISWPKVKGLGTGTGSSLPPPKSKAPE